jgi:hypothetical protein
MIKPVRITRSRQHKQVSPNGLPIVYVGRGSKWGNPYRVKKLSAFKQNKPCGYNQFFVESNEDAVEFYKRFLSLELKIAAEIELKGKNLSCWCSGEKACHADYLLEVANNENK